MFVYNAGLSCGGVIVVLSPHVQFYGFRMEVLWFACSTYFRSQMASFAAGTSFYFYFIYGYSCGQHSFDIPVK